MLLRDFIRVFHVALVEVEFFILLVLFFIFNRILCFFFLFHLFTSRAA